MNIPEIPYGKVVDKDGFMTQEWMQYFMRLSQELQDSFSKEGVSVPLLSTTDIGKLTAPTTKGRLIYDETTNEAKININGTFRVIQVV